MIVEPTRRGDALATATGADPTPPASAPLPATETHQPDPMLQLSTGRMSGGGLTVFGVAVAVILGIVFYGLNSRSNSEQATSPVAHNAQPQSGGHSGGATPRANESGTKG